MALAQGATMEDTATIVVTDNNGATAEVTVTITITGVNEAPTAEDGTGAVTAGMDMAATGDVKAMDVDVGDTHTFAVGTAASNGTLTVDEAGGAWSYALDHDNEAVVALAQGATMEDTATIVVTDNNGATAEVTVTITITGVNEAPTAEDGAGAVTAGMDMAATGDVKAMDVDVGDTHTFAVATAATYGTLTVDEAGGAWSYAVDDANATVVALAQGATMEDTATIVVTDNNGATAEVTVTITITGVNEAPTAEDGTGAVTAGMDMAATGDVKAMDVDVGDTHTFAVATAATYGTLTVDEAGGAWSYAVDDANATVVALAQGATMEDTATIVVTDNNGATAEVTVTITITGVNEAPTAEDGTGAVTAGMDMAATGDVKAMDVDVGDTHTFAVGTAASNGTLTVDEAGGAWSYALDHDNEAVVALAEGATMEDTATIVISDNNGGSAEVTVTITITGVNEAPTAEDGAGAVTAGMDMAAIGDVKAMDVDVGDTHTFAVATAATYGTLTVDEAGAWSYAVDDANATVVALAQGATMEDTATVMIDDGNGGTAEVTVTVTITGANDAPSVGVADGETPDGMPAVSTVAENTMGALLGAVTLSDPDGQVLGMGDVTTSDNRFVIKPDSEGGLWLALADDASLDHEEAATVDVTLTVTDEHGATGETTATITVSNVDEPPNAPTVVPRSDLTVAENDESGPNVAQLLTSDPEGDTYAFSVDNDKFEIENVGNASLLKLKDGMSLDHEASADGTITLMVTATDAAGNTSDATPVVIIVSDVNEAPTAEDGAGAVTAGMDMAATGDVKAMDVDVGDTHTFAVATAATYGTLTVDEAGAWSYAVDDANATVVALAQGATMEDTATVMIDDGNGGTAEVTVTVTITGANDAPSVGVADGETPDGMPAVSTVAENTMGALLGAVTLSDPDGQVLGMGDVTTSDNRFVIEPDSEGGLWLALADDASLDHEKAATVDVTLTVTDEHGATGETTVTITVTNVDEAPYAPMVTPTESNLMVAENDDSGANIALVTAHDPEDGAVSFVVDNTDFEIEVVGTAALLKLKDGVSLDHEATEGGTITLMVTAFDLAGNTSAATPVVVTVTDVNEVPTAENWTGAVTALADMPATGDVNAMDVDDDTLTYTVETQATFGMLSVDEAGAWSYAVDDANAAVVALAQGATMEDTATVMVSDGELSTTAMVTITITGANEDPTAEDGAGAVTAGMDMAATGDVNAMDVDVGDTHTFAVATAASNGTLTVDEAGAWSYALDHDNEAVVALAEGATMEDTATIVVTDNNGATAEVTVTITITGVNEAPTAEDGTGAVTAGMDMAATGDVKAMDVDVGDTHTFAVGTAASNGTLSVDEAGAWSYAVDDANAAVVALAQGATMEDTATVMVTDNNGGTTEATVTITITGANEDPTAEDGTGAVTALANMPATGNVNAMDVDDGDTHTYAVGTTQATNGTFSVDEAGAWSYAVDDANAAVVALAHGESMEDTATVMVADNNGGTTEATVTITINGKNEAPDAPTVTPSTGLTVTENDTNGVNLAQLSTTDPEGDDVTFAVDNPDFEIQEIGGVVLLKVKDGVELDYEDEATMDGTITLMVTATDGVDTSEGTAVMVTVTDVNETPTISVMDGETPNGMPALSTVDENTTGPVGEIVNSDPESGLSGPVTILTNADGGYVVTDADGDQLTFTVSDSRFIVKEDPLGGIWLVLNEAVDGDTESEVMVTVTVSDGLLSTMADVTITITDINEPPTITVEPGFQPAADEGAVASASGAIAENATGPVYEIIVADQEGELTEANVAIDDARFGVETDSEGGLWAVLNEEVNYEELGEVKSIDIVVTVTDSGGLTESVSKTVTINDANDAPTGNQPGVLVVTTEATATDPQVTMPMQNLIATAGTGVVQMTFDLGAMFSDEDGDTNFRYHLEDGPAWLKLINVQYGSDGSVTGQLVGTAPADALPETLNIKLVATDEGGASGDVTFNVILDDGNDTPTNITLTNADGTENAFLDVDVNENDDTGAILGYLDVDDQDSELHPNGQHIWTVDKNDPNMEKFEIVVMDDGRVAFKVEDGVTFDHEKTSSITVTVTATDQGKGNLDISEDITVDINDQNDDPIVKNAPGNWWVTAPDNLDEEDVVAGGWLIFEVENQFDEDAFPLFTDQDADDNKLSYSLVGDSPSWLEIDAETGVIQNSKGAVPVRGVYDVTVRATDSDDATAQASFKLAVAVSDDGNGDNDRPDIERGSGNDIDENSAAGIVVATLTIADEDLDLEGIHPWGDLTITIVANDVDDDIARHLATSEYTPTSLTPKGAWFNLVETGRDSESRTYNVVLTATGSRKMDHEMVEDVRLTITVTDGITGSTDSRNINFDVDDVNEKATLDATEAGKGTHSTNIASKTYTVDQKEDAVEMIYLNLTKLFTDPDAGTDPEDLLFSEVKVVGSTTPWLTLVQEAVAWEDIKDGADEDADTPGDNVTWGPGTDPEDDDIVAIFSVDRTGTNIGQDADGAITITVRDDDRASATTNTEKIAVKVTDQDLNPGDDDSETSGVKVSDSNPDQGDTIRMTFTASVDPDFTGEDKGSPVVILYQWSRGDPDDDDVFTLVDVAVDNPSPYSTTQKDVGQTIKGSVVYYELFDDAIVKSSSADDAGGMLLQATTAAVDDRQDAATGTITFTMTNGTNELVADVSIMDPDGPVAPEMMFTWEWSENGIGGWKPFPDGDTDDMNNNDAMTVIPAAQVGKYVRLVVEFDDANGTNERVVSDAIKVGAISTLVIDAADAEVTIDPGPLAGGAVPEGRVLTIDNLPKGASVQWLSGTTPIAGATGNEFTVTSAQAGMPISAVITSLSAGAVTSIVTLVATVNVVGTVAANSAPQVVAEAADIHDVGAATNEEGEIFETSTTVNMASLFDDAEDDKLTYDFSRLTQEFGMDTNAEEGSGDIDVYESPGTDGNATFDQLLFVNEATGAVQYFTTLTHTHDGNADDGKGNLLTMTLVANDALEGDTDLTDNVSAKVEVSLRIDVEATAINVGRPAEVKENEEAPEMASLSQPSMFKTRT